VIDFVHKPNRTKSWAKRKRNLVLGVGLNDAAYQVTYFVNGKQVMCPFYSTWHNILQRCYSAAYQEKHPTYKDCTVEEYWHLFSNFRAWMLEQPWKGNELDRKICSPSTKIYSANTCAFVPESLINLVTDRTVKQSPYPQGVSYSKRDKKFVATCTVKGRQTTLGYFTSVEAAAKAYNLAKATEIVRIALLQTDLRVRYGLLQHAKLRIEA